MKTKGKRIIEDLFDVAMETMHHDIARKRLTKDLRNHNVTYNPDKNCFTIETSDGTRTLYTITIN